VDEDADGVSMVVSCLPLRGTSAAAAVWAWLMGCGHKPHTRAGDTGFGEICLECTGRTEVTDD
jgi:hypothetical protein